VPTKSENPFKTLVSLLVFMVSKVLFVPAAEFLTRVTMIDFQSINDSDGISYSLWLTFQLLNILSIITLLIVVFYGKRIMTLNMPYVDMVPWSSASGADIVYLEIVAKCLPPVLIAIGNDSANMKVIGNLIVQSAYLLAKLMSTNTFCRDISLVILLTQASSVLIMEIGALELLLGGRYSNQVYMLIFLIGVQGITAYSLNSYIK
jgi:hypothetical protein